MTAKQLQAVSAILKRRFPNLTTEETIALACELIDAALKEE